MGKVTKYGWELYNNDIEQIFNSIKEPYDFIVGLERGGIIPATHLAYKFNSKPLIFNWSRDEKDYSQKIIFDRIVQKNYKILIIDDIIDTGETLQNLVHRYNTNNIDIACLVWNCDQKLITPKYYGRKIYRSENDNYIKFWWEQ